MGCGSTLALRRASAPLRRLLEMNLFPMRVLSLIFSASKYGMSAREHSYYLPRKSTGAKKQQARKEKYKNEFLRKIAKIYHPGNLGKALWWFVMEEIPLVSVSSSGVLFCDCIYFRIPKQRMELDASSLLTSFCFDAVESE